MANSDLFEACGGLIKGGDCSACIPGKLYRRLRLPAFRQRVTALRTRHLLLQIRVEVSQREFIGVDQVDPFPGITLVGDGARVFLPFRSDIRRDVTRN